MLSVSLLVALFAAFLAGCVSVLSGLRARPHQRAAAPLRLRPGDGRGSEGGILVAYQRGDVLAFRDLVDGEDISLSLVPAAFLGKVLGTAFLSKCSKLSAFSYRLFTPRAFLPAL
jgi:hypothetical protein